MEPILDTLYGQIPHGDEDQMAVELYQTATFARLRDISLSSVPSRMSPTGQAASRFEHSVGVAYLGRRLCQRRPVFRPYRNAIIAACLLHDTGSVAFSHTTEIFQKHMTNKTHEQAVAGILQRKEIATILTKYDVDPEEVMQLIEGKHPVLGGLVAGSIDLDNLDNSARLLRSLGAVKEPHYDPAELCYAFTLRNGKLGLDASYLKEILGWAECRQQLYGEVLYGDTNQSAANMLYRALEIAYSTGNLPREFFTFGESEAITWLTKEAPKASRKLVKAALRWRFYKLLHELPPVLSDKRLARLASDWQARKVFADELAKQLQVPAEAVTVYVGRDKGARKIPLPFYGEHAEACAALFGSKQGKQRLRVFVDAEAVEINETNAKRANEIIEQLLADVEPSESEKNYF